MTLNDSIFFIFPHKFLHLKKLKWRRKHRYQTKPPCWIFGSNFKKFQKRRVDKTSPIGNVLKFNTPNPKLSFYLFLLIWNSTIERRNLGPSGLSRQLRGPRIVCFIRITKNSCVRVPHNLTGHHSRRLWSINHSTSRHHAQNRASSWIVVITSKWINSQKIKDRVSKDIVCDYLYTGPRFPKSFYKVAFKFFFFFFSFSKRGGGGQVQRIFTSSPPPRLEPGPLRI